ncbi:hypothetical protein CBER1_01404 [Cercospora berteroae]|uniref:Uncharacterized protein n=1 Tax=Cercospora berteroae TaxID=357750 RepID=A0A2S6CCE2_9PEZI|nr:hypothetical protein CBER1_01404 [Cercospora berteroae]
MLGLQIDSGPNPPSDDVIAKGGGSGSAEDTATSHNSSSQQRRHVNVVEPPIPVAICGMALGAPGGAASPEEFWDFLINKGDGRTKVPKSRYNVDAHYSPEKKAGAIASEHGYFLGEDVSLGALDTSRFTLSRTELEFADPQQRLMLEVVREAFDDAGEVNYKGARIGCYLGNMGEDWGELMNRDPLSHRANRIDGYNDWMLGNRISYEFGLTGPSLTIRTACSSSLVGLNEACAAMQRGASEGAIVAGSTIIMAPGTTQSMSEKGILGPDGSCKTFSADANGYARGEAIVALYVKPLEAAIRDGNPIRAVIRSALSNSDGKTQGITNPNPVMHEALIRKAYELAGLNPKDTAFFECHGTGTAVGDPLETGAVANVFGDDGIHITSIKPNIGHTEGASGLMSLIKAVKSLEHKTIPPNIKFTTPNPKIPFKERKLTVPVEPTPFPEDRAERVSVNSFGLGGSNAHVIADSARSFGITNEPQREQAPSEMQLLLFSAGSSASLKTMISDYEDLLVKQPELLDSVDDMAYTLANRREHLPYRAFKVVGQIESPASVGKKTSAKAPELVMCFTGQGAQWPRMGHDLMKRDDLPYQKTIRVLDEYLQALPEPPKWTLEKELSRTGRTSNVQKAEFSQPLCTAVQIALVDLLRSVGVKPAAVVGHSSGELGAAYAAGALTAKEAIIGAYQRGQAATLQDRKGAMAAVGLGWAEVEKYLSPPHRIVACENSPKSVTISGDADAVQQTLNRIKEDNPDITARLLKVERAYHSYHMAEIGDKYLNKIAEHVGGKAPELPFFSSVTGSGEPEQSPLDASYWVRNLASPVLFSRAVAGLLKHIDNPVFLEVGPHGALAGPARQIFAQEGASPPYLSAMVRNENCVEKYLAAIGSLFENNISVDFKTMFPGEKAMSGLPRYPWNHEQEYWYESRMSKEWRWPAYPKHELLGRRCLETTDFNPSFRNLVSIAEAPWLRDHMIDGTVIFPAAGYAAMAGEAARQLSGKNDAYSLKHVVLNQALVLPKMLRSKLLHRSIAIVSATQRIVTAKEIEAAPAQVEAESLPRKISKTKIYDSLAGASMEYGPEFQLLESIETDTVARKATATLGDHEGGGDDAYHLHPTVIDAALQTGLIASVPGKVNSGNLSAMPTLLEDVTIVREDTDAADVKVVADTDVMPGSGEIQGAFQVIADGKAVMDVPKAHFTPVSTNQKKSEHQLPVTARVEWRQHVDFQNIDDLVVRRVDRNVYTPALDSIGKLCIEYIQRHIQRLEQKSEDPTVSAYTAWIGRQFEIIGKDSPMLKDSGVDSDALPRIEEACKKLEGTPVAGCAAALYKVASNIDNLLTSKVTGYELLGADDTLMSMFQQGNTIDTSKLVQSIAHAQPNLRVLEVGAISGDSTAALLALLQLPIAKPMYSKYTVSSHSSSSFGDLKKRFADKPNMEYRVLDIEQKLEGQGFADDQYDLIIATNTLHGGKSLQQGLANCKKLLAPSGRLVISEITSDSKWVNVACGLFEDWWNGQSDEREQEPYATPDRWQSELEKAELKLKFTTLDGDEPNQLSALYVAQPNVPAEKSKAVTILEYASTDRGNALADLLAKNGWKVDRSDLGAALPASQDVIALLEEETPFLESPSEENFKAFQAMLADLAESGLFWVTKLSQINCTNPRFAQIIGASRSIRNEELLSFVTCEVDDLDASMDKVVQAFARFQARSEGNDLRPDLEYAIADGGIYVPRVYPFELADEPIPDGEADARMSLAIDSPGRLGSLHWDIGIREELDNNAAVEDVAQIMGHAPYPAGGLGTDASGIISRVGPAVKDFAVGDRVMCLGAGAIASYVVTPSALCEKLPSHMTWEQAAGLPTAYCTAAAALDGLKPGQSVLIHNASHGVAQAAAFLAIALGAKVYATTTNADHLATAVRIPRERIFTSEDSSFVQDVMRETNDKGVDLVLDTLTGALLHDSWKCVAEFGKMVELGSQDILASAQLDMSSFLGGRSFTGVFLDAMIATKPEKVNRLLQTIAQLVEEERIAPLMPCNAHEISDVQKAVKAVQDEKHTGQTVLKIRDPQGNLQIDSAPVRAADERVLKLDSSASYLLAGGLGGIGSVIARHLVEHGARRIVSMSRNPGSREEEKAIIHELESMGCEVTLVAGNMIKQEDIARAVRESSNLKGVVHSPMLVADEGFENMSLEQWHRASDPKVKGAWYLHEAVTEAGFDLDFFLFLSSMSGLNGQPGQANCSGANTFLDAFVQYRNGLGLAASFIDIGAVADMGFAARDEALLKRLLTNGYSGCTETEILDAVTAAIQLPPASKAANTSAGGSGCAFNNTFATGFGSRVSLSSQESRSWWKTDLRMAVWHNIGAGDEKSDDGNNLKAFIAKAKAEPELLKAPDTAGHLAVEIGRHLMALLLQEEDEIDISLPVDQCGLDSLVGIELRNWWKQTFGFDISVLQLLGMGTLESLGKAAAEGMEKALNG